MHARAQKSRFGWVCFSIFVVVFGGLVSGWLRGWIFGVFWMVFGSILAPEINKKRDRFRHRFLNGLKSGIPSLARGSLASWVSPKDTILVSFWTPELESSGPEDQ